MNKHEFEKGEHAANDTRPIQESAKWAAYHGEKRLTIKKKPTRHQAPPEKG